MKTTIQLLTLAIVNSILFAPIESKAVSPFCNPIKNELNSLKLSNINRFKIKDSFTLKSGEYVEVFIHRYRGLARSLILSIHNYKTHKDKDKNIYEIKIKYVEDHPKCYVIQSAVKDYPKCYVIQSANVYISRFGAYTLNPRSMSDKFERPGLRSYLQHIGIEGIVLELLDLTENGEAKVRLENIQNK
jgi:hypothetical protein